MGTRREQLHLEGDVRRLQDVGHLERVRWVHVVVHHPVHQQQVALEIPRPLHCGTRVRNPWGFPWGVRM